MENQFNNYLTAREYFKLGLQPGYKSDWSQSVEEVKLREETSVIENEETPEVQHKEIEEV